MYNPFALSDKRILITGASSGIGRSCADVFARLGAKLILVGRNEQRLTDTLANLPNPKDHLAYSFDLSQLDRIEAWVKEKIRDQGIVLDGCVHSAGAVKFTPIRSLDIEQTKSIMEINVHAGLLLLKACMNKKTSNPGSCFVFISSTAAFSAVPGNISYAASKSALLAVTKTAAKELAPRCRVNAIAPGLVQTDLIDFMGDEMTANISNLHPLGIGKPEDVAYAAAYFVSDAAKWVTGSILTVDGGVTC